MTPEELKSFLPIVLDRENMQNTEDHDESSEEESSNDEDHSSANSEEEQTSDSTDE